MLANQASIVYIVIREKCVSLPVVPVADAPNGEMIWGVQASLERQNNVTVSQGLSVDLVEVIHI